MLLSGLWAWCLTLSAATQPAGGVPATQPEFEGIAVSPPSPARGSFYWLLRPEGYRPATDRPALLIVLHGSDDTALDAVKFWAERRHDVPFLLASHQATGQGWRNEDLPALAATLADLRKRVPFDERRILLAGFSAGGALAMHLLYEERWPFCAVAALANYVPPAVTADEVRARRQVPVFYAVGMKDINHDRMRTGLDMLRSCGADIDLYRPQIGHVLDPQVGQSAMDWFMLRARRAVAARIDAVKDDASRESAAVLEEILEQHRWHDHENVETARRALEKLEAPARERLQRAQTAAIDQRPLDALELLDGLEDQCLSRRLLQDVILLRQSVLADAPTRQSWESRREPQDDEAMKLYASAQRLVADHQYQKAVARCEEVIQRYADTPAARRAQFLADLLRSKKLAE